MKDVGMEISEVPPLTLHWRAQWSYQNVLVIK